MIPIIIIIGLLIFYLISEKMYFVGILGSIGLFLMICKNYNINHPNQLGNLGIKLKDDYLKFDPINNIIGDKEMESFKNNPSLKLNEIPTSDIYSELPELNEYQNIRDKIIKFIDTIEDGALHTNSEDSPYKNHNNLLKMRIDKIIAYIFYRAHLISTDEYFPQQNYVDLQKNQKDLLNTLNNFIFLNMSDEQDVYLSGLINEVKEINKKINSILIEKVNSKMTLDNSSNVKNYMGFLPELDAPEPIDLTDDNFMQGQFTNW